jgi:amidohydrolase
MTVTEGRADVRADMIAWRRDLHAHPELGNQERRTAAAVAERLISWGIEVATGIGGTGVVGTLKGRNDGSGVIGLRADMDALALTETNRFAHVSTSPGVMHACGHDGHTTMLLGAARMLAENPDFSGTVRFIFQPAEEGRAGAAQMIRDGLFKRFPVDAVYGMHNWPQLPAGTFAMRSGPMMAATDRFDITVTGHGTHAAMPHLGVDPVVIAAHFVTAAQTLISRGTEPADAAVVSVTMLNAGSAENIIPHEATLVGTVRTLRNETRDRIQSQIGRLAKAIAEGFGASASIRYQRGYPVTANTAAETEIAARAAAKVVGGANVRRVFDPAMAAEDFGYMLEECPGCYVWVGQGGADEGRSLHNSGYDFNDDILTTGADYWVELVRTALPAV